ncbi:MAG: hypothetical protein AAF202_02715, partial [Pseudomonadota bacterium]
ILASLLLSACQSGDQLKVEKRGVSSGDAIKLMNTTPAKERPEVLRKLRSFRAPGFDWQHFWSQAVNFQLTEPEASSLAAIGSESCHEGFSAYSEYVAFSSPQPKVIATFADVLASCNLEATNDTTLSLARTVKDSTEAQMFMDLTRVAGTLDSPSEDLLIFVAESLWSDKSDEIKNSYVSLLNAEEVTDPVSVKGFEVLSHKQDDILNALAKQQFEGTGQYFEWTFLARSRARILKSWPWGLFFEDFELELAGPAVVAEMQLVFPYVCDPSVATPARLLIENSTFSPLLSTNRSCLGEGEAYGSENLELLSHAAFTGLDADIDTIMQILFEQSLTQQSEDQAWSLVFEPSDDLKWITILNYLRSMNDSPSIKNLFAVFQNVVGKHPYIEADLVAMAESSAQFNEDYEKYNYSLFENQTLKSEKLSVALAQSNQIGAEGFETLMSKARPVCNEPTRTQLLTRALALEVPSTITLTWMAECAKDLPIGLVKNISLQAISNLPGHEVAPFVQAFSRLKRANQDWYWTQMESSYSESEWRQVGQFVAQDLSQFAKLISDFGSSTRGLLAQSLNFQEIVTTEALDTLTREVGRLRVLSLMTSLWQALPASERSEQLFLNYAGIAIGLFEQEVKNSEARSELIEQAVSLLKSLDLMTLESGPGGEGILASQPRLQWLGTTSVTLALSFQAWPSHDLVSSLPENPSVEAVWMAYYRSSVEERQSRPEELQSWWRRFDQALVNQNSAMTAIIKSRLELSLQSLNWQSSRNQDSYLNYKQVQNQFCQTLESYGIDSQRVVEFDLQQTKQAGCLFVSTKSELLAEQVSQSEWSFQLDSPLASHPDSLIMAPGANLEVKGASWQPGFVDLSVDSAPQDWVSLPILMGVYVEKGSPERLISSGLHHFVFNLLLRKSGDSLETVSYKVFGYSGGDLKIENSFSKGMSFVSSGDINENLEPNLEQGYLQISGQNYGVGSQLAAWVNTWVEGEYWTPGRVLEIPTDNLKHHFKAQPNADHLQFIIERASKGVSGEPMLFFNPTGFDFYWTEEQT